MSHAVWKPGQPVPINPAGMGSRNLTDALETILEKCYVQVNGAPMVYKLAIALKLCDLALDGDLEAIRLVWDRIEGKPADNKHQQQQQNIIDVTPMDDTRRVARIAELLNLADTRSRKEIAG